MKYEAEDVRAIVDAAVQMVRAYVDGTGAFPINANLSNMIDGGGNVAAPVDWSQRYPND
jgi:hypothetical protein